MQSDKASALYQSEQILEKFKKIEFKFTTFKHLLQCIKSLYYKDCYFVLF